MAESQPLPLEGIRILAVEQMQAIPFGTQLLARLGADVVKVEHPVHGESGRAGAPSITDVDGSQTGATFLRNNLAKRSIGIDLKNPKGADLVRRLVSNFDVVTENFKPGTMERLGLGYEQLAEIHPGLVYVSVSGFGSLRETPYGHWPAYASVAEAMGGFYSFRPEPGRRPNIGVGGAIGDIGTGLFAMIGLLAALQGRQRTGRGQKVDVAMLDAIISIMDMVAFAPSIGITDNSVSAWPGILESFEASDGLFVLQVGREHQFERLCQTIGRTEWLSDPRFASREGWSENLDGVIRPAIEAWASDKTKLEACTILAESGVVAGPSYEGEDLLADPHVKSHEMLVEIPAPSPTGVVRVHGNPIKFSSSPEGPAAKWPLIGEHTNEILGADLGLGEAELEVLRREKVIR
ncbi:MAG: CoA transferase [Deltaproteobacteria bacterium]|nr:CoA transferase [Deltaproteobacteria bacterium]